MTIQQYIDNLNRLYKTGNAREHSYRGDLQILLASILPADILVTNEPARVECGAPDYVLTKGKDNIPVGYIEAKDIGVKLDSKTLKEQFDRYRNGLSNLIITDYLQFDFYRDGEKTTSITIGKIENDNIVPVDINFNEFTELIKNFAVQIPQSIRNPQRLAEMLAGKARLMADVIFKSLEQDDLEGRNSEMKAQMETFKRMLIHDIDNKSYSDIYAQTIAYGMFAARYNDPTLPTFSRMEAAELIPKSNPFLRKLFHDIAGFDLDERLVWIVEELVQIFLATDVAKIMKNFGKSTKMEDPIIHFYETFLAEYDKSLRKARGVWYTPQPVVNFIVRAVDDILKDEFGLARGLADTSKTKIKVATQNYDKVKKKYIEETREVHRVQILDPATGTGTFLAETIQHIHSKFKGMEGMWPKYVKEDLIPRLNGFELLMASYAMAHLKMDMLLQETGYKGTDDQRFRIFLTNSLEEAHPDSGTLFSSWLSDESTQANAIKNDTPVMVVIGNPPYSGESANKGSWIMNLMEDYKKEPGGKEKLKEQNSKFINDDYVKFMRFGQYFIEKNGTGVLAFINPHGFLDNPTFRGMRWNLLKTYDKIYTIDLHGNSKKKETAPDGSIDQNVFDIMQGVSINLLVKTGKKNANDLGQVLHYDLFGKRESKYTFLNENNISSINFSLLENIEPNFFFVSKDFKLSESYNKGIQLTDLFILNSLGLLTKKDKFITDFYKEKIKSRLEELANADLTDEYLASKYALKLKDNDKWNLTLARNTLYREGIDQSKFKVQNYRCFDKRYIYYHYDFVARLNTKVLGNFANKNLGLISTRQLASDQFHHIFISNIISDQCFISNKTKEGCQVFPLYLYNDSTQTTIDGTSERTPNLKPEIVKEIATKLGLTFTNEKESTAGTFAPIDLLDYIYAVLHSPKYRETYKEFLKIDFPRVPYPTDAATFWQLVELGQQIREIHLLESPVVENFISSYPQDGTNIVEKPRYEQRNHVMENGVEYINDTPEPEGRVYINDTQYFENVPEVAWYFYIGGYQPAQKWLKDRKDMELSYDDIAHYNKIIVALTETDRLMKEVDKVEFF